MELTPFRGRVRIRPRTPFDIGPVCGQFRARVGRLPLSRWPDVGLRIALEDRGDVAPAPLTVHAGGTEIDGRRDVPQALAGLEPLDRPESPHGCEPR